MKKDFLLLQGLEKETLRKLLRRALEMKQNPKTCPASGKILGLVFQKPSTRTRVSMEVAARQLGGTAIYLGPDEVGLGKRESPEDMGRVLSRYLDCIAARVFEHDLLARLAKFSSIPVINSLSDVEHPCQALADLMTIQESVSLDVPIVYVGDFNNVSRSLAIASAILGLHLTFTGPKSYSPGEEELKELREQARENGGEICYEEDPGKAVKDARILYTDVWVSMGQEKEKEEKIPHFFPYQVNQKLLSAAGKDCKVLHCLPAHRGEEITDEVLDGPNSLVFDQAENRLHSSKAVLEFLGFAAKKGEKR